MTAPARPLFFALLLLPLSGCVTPDLGEVYLSDFHGADGNTPRIVMYPRADVDPDIVFYLSIDGKRVGRLFQETFVSHSIEAGAHEVSAQEYWNGRGAGKDLADAANPLKLFEPVEVDLPESLNPGVRTTRRLEMTPGEVVYLRLEKDEGKEYFYACGETRDTMTMCSGVRYDTVIEIVDKDEAEHQLAGRRESL